MSKEIKLTTFQRLVLDCLSFDKYMSIQELIKKPLYKKYLNLHINTLYLIMEELNKFKYIEKVMVGTSPDLKAKYFKTQKVFKRIKKNE